MTRLDDERIERYSRQLILDEVGAAGQETLLGSSVLVIGAGALGSPVVRYLAGAGVGRLTIADGDRVESSNLHRQVLHRIEDIGRSKAESAADAVRATNPDVTPVPVVGRVGEDDVLGLVEDHDVVVDGSDNFATRYLLNDACHLAGVPLVEAAILRFHGQLTTIVPGEGPCYRCVFPEPPAPGAAPSCAQAGILGPVAGVIGSLQAVEVLKLLLGTGGTLVGRLLFVDLATMDIRTADVRRRPECALCGDEPTITGLEMIEESCATGIAADGGDARG